jgi:cytochrome c biogenesis protein ResB
LRFDEAGRYARLSVVDDWSVYVMYALLGIAIAGLSVAILVPRRTAWVLLEQTDDGVALRLLTVHERRDPNFEVIAEDALLAIPGAHRIEGDS